MWIYRQSTGALEQDGCAVGKGYAGTPEGRNNPELQTVSNVGPLPAGKYSIGKPCDTVDHGPFVLRLTPDNSNRMFGRAGFLIHGDSKKAPGTASHGCIILPRGVREKIALSGDCILTVVP
jgi:Protein of unknown function (DUF2778)